MNAPSRHAPCHRPRLIHMGNSDRFGAFLPSDADVPTHLGVGRRVSDERLQQTAASYGYEARELIAFRDDDAFYRAAVEAKDASKARYIAAFKTAA